MRTFKTKAFARFADREGLEDAALHEAAGRLRRGLIDADLGGGVIKQRIARKGGGRSGGFRTIVLLRRGELAFFVHGFAKSSRKTLRRDELAAFRFAGRRVSGAGRGGPHGSASGGSDYRGDVR